MAADSQAFERGQRVQGPRHGGPGALRRFMLAGMASISYPGSQAEQLLLAPQELRTADPASPPSFTMDISALPAARGAQRRLPVRDRAAIGRLGTRALRLRLAPPSARSRQRALARAGQGARRRLRPAPALDQGACRQPEIVGRRVISWLSNSALILDSGEPQAYEDFLRALTSQLPLPLRRAIAIAHGVSVRHADGAHHAGLLHRRAAGGGRSRYAPVLQELERQILPDGGILAQPGGAGRAPVDLLPLRRCFRGTRPRPAEGADRRHRPHHADAALLPHRRRHARALQRLRGRRRPTRSPRCSPTTMSRARM